MAALYALRASVHALLTADDFQAAAGKKEEIIALVEDITELPVCMFCFVQSPSSHVRNNNIS